MNVIGLGLGQSASRFLGLGFSPGAAAPGASAITLSGNTVSYGGQVIGVIDGAADGVGRPRSTRRVVPPGIRPNSWVS